MKRRIDFLKNRLIPCYSATEIPRKIHVRYSFNDRLYLSIVRSNEMSVFNLKGQHSFERHHGLATRSSF